MEPPMSRSRLELIRPEPVADGEWLATAAGARQPPLEVRRGRNGALGGFHPCGRLYPHRGCPPHRCQSQCWWERGSGSREGRSPWAAGETAPRMSDCPPAGYPAEAPPDIDRSLFRPDRAAPDGSEDTPG